MYGFIYGCLQEEKKGEKADQGDERKTKCTMKSGKDKGRLSASSEQTEQEETSSPCLQAVKQVTRLFHIVKFMCDIVFINVFVSFLLLLFAC
jgi:hypothetical protein